MDEKKTTTPKRRKMPLKQRVARAIVQAVEGGEKKKQPRPAQKTQGPTQSPVQRTQRPTPPTQSPVQRTQRPTPPTQSPAPRTQRPTPPTQSPAPRTQRPTQNIAHNQNAPYRAPAAQPGRRPPMTPEQRRRRALALQRMRRRRKIIRIAAAVVALLLTMLVLSRTVLFKIQKIDVTNPKDANYTVEQIVTASGVTFGAQNLFTCDLKKTGKNIEQYLPYIGAAEVKRNFPDTLQVTVTPTKAAAAVAFGTGYLLIDANGKMLENVETAPETVPVLRCKTEFEVTLGQTIGVPTSGRKADDATKAAAQMITLYKSILKAISDAKIDEITLIDIRDVRAITLMYQNRLTLHLGTEDMLDQKLKTAAKTIAAERDASRTRNGAIDLTNVPYAYARDTYETVEEETATDVSEPETTEQTE